MRTDEERLEDFREMMTKLVEREGSQYSYRNTLVALCKSKVVGTQATTTALFMNCGRRSSKPQRSILEKTFPEWTKRHRQGKYVFTLSPSCQNIVISELKEVFFKQPRSGPT